MKRLLTLYFFLAVGAIALPLSSADAAGLYGPGSSVVGFNLDGPFPDSSTPGSGNEEAIYVVDQNADTKYLNFGVPGTGFIVTPAFGSSIIQSLKATAANDAPDRDPLKFEIYGTNDAIVSTEHSFGNLENWTSIGTFDSGLATDPGRKAMGATIDIPNSTAYSSYRIFIPEYRDNNSIMQLADLSLFTESAGGGSQILASGDPTIAVTTGLLAFPVDENPGNLLDMDPSTKYLNFTGANSGFIVSNGSPQIVDSLTFTTANDHSERDPLTWELYGTNDPITSTDNGNGSDENWTLVALGGTDLFQFAANDATGRLQTGATQPFGNSTAYGAYRLVFPEIRDASAANSMQLADVVFGGPTNVPEPTSMALALIGLAACGLGRRRS